VARTLTLVLAAGRGARMGGPKALLLIEGRTLAELHVERASTDDVRVVVRRAWAHLPSSLVSDAPDELGPAGSISAAVAQLEPYERIIVTHVDRMPRPRTEVARLLAALDHHAAARFDEDGHPIAVRGSALYAAYACRSEPLREILAELDVARVPGGAPSVHLNTPADVERLTGAPPRFRAMIGS
jgi:molybdenum cofactor cytidylyltransferase